MHFVFVNPKDGARCRMSVTDCDTGQGAVAGDVAEIRYTVYEINDFTGYHPVSGHENIPVAPTSAMLGGYSYDEDSGDTYNFEHTISPQNAKPFPRRRAQYAAEFTLTDTLGRTGTAAFYFTTDENYYEGTS